MKDEIKYRRIGDDRVLQLVNGKPVGFFRLKGWLNNLMSYPDKTKGGSSRGRRMNRFTVSQFEYEGKWE